jgi:sigma-E factor negative regulatory protein RseA
MTDQIREQLSALLDGELPRDEFGLLMRRVERDPELRRTFGAYALIGETLRAPGGRVATQPFAARVSAAIDAPPAAASPDRAVPAHVVFWKRPAVRTALAAGAAAAAVLIFRPEGAQQQVASAQPDHYTTEYSFASSPTPAQAQRLAGYMVAHSQYSTPMVRRNVLTSLLAADPGIMRASYETSAEAP